MRSTACTDRACLRNTRFSTGKSACAMCLSRSQRGASVGTRFHDALVRRAAASGTSRGPAGAGVAGRCGAKVASSRKNGRFSTTLDSMNARPFALITSVR